MNNPRPYLIGITGGSASGKTLFLNRLLREFPSEKITLISQDHYYRPRDEQPVDENGVKNFDVPESIDSARFSIDVESLKRGESIKLQEYTFNNPNAVPRELEFKPAPVIIIEGLFVMYFPEVNDLLDLRIFVDAQDHIKLKRRIIRDKIERGYDLDDVLYRYEKHVMPTFYKYLEPLRHDADLVIPNNTHFDNALKVLTGFIHHRLNDSQKNVV